MRYWLACLCLVSSFACSDDDNPNDQTPLSPGDSDPTNGDGDANLGDEDGAPGDFDPSDPCANRETRIPNQDPEWRHVPEDGVDGGVIDYLHNPPASGPHYFTWARYGQHDEPVPAPNYVHNLEHGAIVILYRPDAPPEVKEALDEAYELIPNFEAANRKFVVMSPAPDLPHDFAVLSWHWMLTNACGPQVPAIVDFATRRVGNGREDNRFGDGTYPMGGPCSRWYNAVDNQWTYEVPEDGPAPEYLANPPASGPHYPRWAKYQAYDTAVPRGYWVGNLERGGVVMAYNPSAPAEEIAKFKDVYARIANHWPCGHKMTLLTPDPLLPSDTPFYIITWDAFMRASCVEDWPFIGYAQEMRFGRTTSVCDDGTYP